MTKSKIAFTLIVQVFSFMLPWGIRRIFLRLIGFDLHKTARIGYSFFWGTKVKLCAHSHIGSLNCFKYLGSVELNEYSSIGNMNWFSGSMTSLGYQKKGIILAAHSAITNRHYIDCNCFIHIGAYATIAGVRSQIFTHSINIKDGTQDFADITVGSFSFVGTAVILLPGSVIPEYAIVSAGSVVRRGMEGASYSLFSGNPAIFERTLDPKSSYFCRSLGAVASSSHLKDQ